MAGDSVLVIGAGVIGRIYVGGLIRSGHDVTVLARGQTAVCLAAEGITLCDGAVVETVRPRVVDTAAGERYDLIVIAVRRDQSPGAIDVAATATGGLIVPMFNNPLGLGGLRERFGADRVVGAFPGVGGYRAADGTVRYLRIRRQPTTVGRNEGREQRLVRAFRAAGFPVALTSDMDAWLATHAVFVVALSAALEHADYSLSRLTGDKAAVRAMVHTVRDGFTALERRGITIQPPALRTIFTRVPLPAAT
ncbi:hypothetical protein GFY24_20475 [Nocardia sp. SYP-A9097]|uniref:ketopantoate reductase family protein n=1 Tax=Nocardia sp. SYP-A9097 TaxID=2663237 RepID=UPI00129B7697|nr:2-dehydropantoate 2-reductase N-terminal domain-containing protein [Nocardia sp. SYP-A9097]MRH89790.1 hypothetical protein [Nocardia sp. SYP-A9097]